jgi:hypothetical protein
LQHENCGLASLDRGVDNWPQAIKKHEFVLWQLNNNAGQSRRRAIYALQQGCPDRVGSWRSDDFSTALF